jgi:hypothetical protein
MRERDAPAEVLPPAFSASFRLGFELMDRRDDAEQQTGQERHSGRVQERPRVDCHALEAWDLGRNQ